MFQGTPHGSTLNLFERPGTPGSQGSGGRSVHTRLLYNYITPNHLKCYGKCSKISNTILYLFSNKMLVFGAGIHKISQNTI